MACLDRGSSPLRHAEASRAQESSRMSEPGPRLRRPKQPMPEFVRTALQKRRLMTAYEERPAYQRNDYLGWIHLAKQEQTKQKRLAQMLDELERGGVYMNMVHRASKK